MLLTATLAELLEQIVHKMSAESQQEEKSQNIPSSGFFHRHTFLKYGKKNFQFLNNVRDIAIQVFVCSYISPVYIGEDSLKV